MDVTVPNVGGRAVRLEWRVEEGAPVVQGQVLAFLEVPGECAYPELRAPGSGQLTARWADVTPAVAGALVAVIDESPGTCRAAELVALVRHRAALDAATARLRAATPGPAVALLAAERRALDVERAAIDARLARLRAFLTAP